MKLLTFIIALAFVVLLPISYAGTVHHQEESFSLAKVIKIYHYSDACSCYRLITDDFGTDNCEWFYNGEHVFNNGLCD